MFFKFLPVNESYSFSHFCSDLSLQNNYRLFNLFSDSISLHTYRSETTLCVPNPEFNYSKKHQLLPPPSIPVHKLLETSLTDVGNSRNSGLQFEVWSRFYYPNVRDQLLAKVGIV